MPAAYTNDVDKVNMISVDMMCVNRVMATMNDRLRQARLAAGYTSAAKAAKALSMGPSTYAAHENGQNDFDAEQAKIYGKRFKVPAAWLLTGEGQGPSKAAARITEQREEASDRSVDIIEPETRAGLGGGGIDFESGAGSVNGITISADVVRDIWSMPSAFISGQLRITPHAAAVIEVYGDSMYDPNNPGAPGSLFPGDRVIVDMLDTTPSPPGAFLVWDGVGMVVKLVEVVRGSEPVSIRLKSRNPAYEPYEATEDEARILGRVRGRISSM